MKAIYSVFVSLLLMGVICSCQKEASRESTDEPEDNTFLSRAVFLDTTLASGHDTAYKMNFHYDSQKRLVNYDFTEYGIGGSILYTSYYNYIYSGNNTSPFKVSAAYYTGATADTYLFYNGGFIIKDSTVQTGAGAGTDVRVRHFTALGSNAYLRRVYQYFSVPGTAGPSDSTIYKTTITSDNILNRTDSFWNSSMASYSKSTQQMSYDNKLNPLNKLNNWGWYYGYSEHLVSEDILISKNNMTSYIYNEVTSGGPGTSVTANFVYTYNSEGYPTIGRVSGGADFNKLLYSYITL